MSQILCVNCKREMETGKVCACGASLGAIPHQSAPRGELEVFESFVNDLINNVLECAENGRPRRLSLGGCGNSVVNIDIYVMGEDMKQLHEDLLKAARPKPSPLQMAPKPKKNEVN